MNEPTELALERIASNAVGQALGVNEILAQVRLIQDVMSKVMTDGEHYGVIPGTGSKKTLLQPGAQKLCMTFRLAPEYELQETNLINGHKEYRVICTLKSIQSGTFVGQGVGCCSTMESKYRYRGGSRKCPDCGKETIIKGKAEFGGGWLCFTKKGGCGSKWEDGAAEIESQSVEKVEHDNPADFFNTILKMAKKRAFVDATITATAASDIFTQDVGDDEGEETTARKAQFHPQPAPARPSPKSATAPATPRAPVEATPEQKDKFLAMLKPVEASAVEYAISKRWILPNEGLTDIGLANVPKTRMEFEAIMEQIQKLVDGQGQESGAEVRRAMDEGPPEVERSAEQAFERSLAPGWWREITVPIPPKGVTKAEYLKNPVTVGSLDKKTMFGWWANFTPKSWTGRDGKEHPPSDADITFREALDAAGKEYEFSLPKA